MSPAGETHVYVLARAGFEDIVKLGMSHQPLVRWQSFHPRWFEAFDLDASWLLRFDTRREARACETGFHRALAAHRCPAPLDMPMVAGGRTEWYRGTQERIAGLAAAFAVPDSDVMRGLAPWTAMRMREQQAGLYELLATAVDLSWQGCLEPAARRRLLDLVDAQACFDASATERFEEQVAVLRGGGAA